MIMGLFKHELSSYEIFETKILNTEIESTHGIGITEIVY